MDGEAIRDRAGSARWPARLAEVVLWCTIVALSASVAWRSSLTGDEAFFGSVALEALETGRGFPLTFEGRPHVGKPPVLIWAMAGSIAAFGSASWAARLPGLLAGLGLLAGTWWVARSALGRGPAALALIALSTSRAALGTVSNHGLPNATMDAALALAVTAALVSIVRAPTLSAGKAGWSLLAVLSVAVKGLPALALLLVAALVLSALVRREQEARAAARGAWLASAVALAAAAAWLAALAAAGTPGVWRRVVERQALQRISEGIDAGHLHGWSFYPEILARDFGPLLLLFLPALWPARGEEPARSPLLLRFAPAYVLAWALSASLSASKLEWYLLPAYPWLGWTLASGFERCLRWSREAGRLRLRVPIWIAVIIVLGLRSATALRTAAESGGLHPLERAIGALPWGRGVALEMDPRLGERIVGMDLTEVFLARGLTRRSGAASTASAPCLARVELESVAGSTAAGRELWGRDLGAGVRLALRLGCAGDPARGGERAPSAQREEGRVSRPGLRTRS